MDGPGPERRKDERRRGERRRTLLGARINTGLHRSDMACVVRNIGPDGLRLALSDGVPLPGTFEVTLDTTRQTRQVRLIWRRNDTVGVAFAPEPLPATPIPIGVMRDLQTTRRENEALRAHLSRLDENRRADGAAGEPPEPPFPG